MLKVLFFDPLFLKGHKSVNNRYLEIYSNLNNKLILCAPPDWFDSSKVEKVIDIGWLLPSESKNSFEYRKKILHNFVLLRSVVEKEHPDLIYIASYDVISFLFAIPIIYKYINKIIIQEHNNVDQLSNKIKLLVYNIYKNQVNHFVFEKFIEERLILLGVKKEKIFVVPHPLPKSIRRTKKMPNEKLIVGLSNSNNDEIVKRLVDEEQKQQLFKRNDIRLILKARNVAFNSDNVNIINKWVSKEEYDEYCNECEYFIIPFSDNEYNYRISNVFLEAVSNNKKILTTSFMLTKFYSERYPGLCCFFENADDIVFCTEHFSIKKYEKARNKFIFDHSDKTIGESILHFFRRCVYNAQRGFFRKFQYHP